MFANVESKNGRVNIIDQPRPESYFNLFDKNKTNKSLERVVLKTIAAFNNTDGGMLVIGVEDNGNILGLERDYESLSADRDRFEQHLLTLISNEYSTGYTAKNILVKFHMLNNHEICGIEISKGEKELFTEVRDKNGQKTQKFFVRRGNASVEISNYSEVTNYIKERF